LHYSDRAFKPGNLSQIDSARKVAHQRIADPRQFCIISQFNHDFVGQMLSHDGIEFQEDISPKRHAEPGL
jgi:hypothetical protein